MTLFDYGVLLIIGFSVLVSVVRGLVRELLALAAWVVAFVVANVASGTVSEWLPDTLGSPSLRVLAAFVFLFVATLILMSLAGMVVKRLIHNAGLSAEDRLLGGMFGFVRGMLVVLVLVLLAGLTGIPREAAWNNAMLSAPLEALAIFVKPWLPQYLSQRITYD
ncbi:MAG TPA: CvpA family protein [Burkholderiales bacterium]